MIRSNSIQPRIFTHWSALPLSASIYLKLGEAVNVGMVPIQARGLGGGNLHGVLKARRARLNHSVEHIILAAGWRMFSPCLAR